MLALPKGRFFLLFTLPQPTSLCLAFYSYIFVTMFPVHYVFIFQLSSFQDFPPMAFSAAGQTSTGALHSSNRACEEPPWYPPSPTWLSKPHTGPHRAEFGFSLQNEFTPPPKGGGAGYHLTWLAGILMQRNPVLFRRKRGTLRIRRLL